MNKHQKLNLKLAKAIGWTTASINIVTIGPKPVVRVFFKHRWRKFDYRSWKTIAPIAERYNLFPYRMNDYWEVASEQGGDYIAKTAQLSIAVAVIGLNRSGQL